MYVSSLGFGFLSLLHVRGEAFAVRKRRLSSAVCYLCGLGTISSLHDTSLFIDFGVQFSLSKEWLSRLPFPWASISGASSDCSLCASKSASTVDAPGVFTSPGPSGLSTLFEVLSPLLLNVYLKCRITQDFLMMNLMLRPGSTMHSGPTKKAAMTWVWYVYMLHNWHSLRNKYFTIVISIVLFARNYASQ